MSDDFMLWGHRNSHAKEPRAGLPAGPDPVTQHAVIGAEAATSETRCFQDM